MLFTIGHSNHSIEHFVDLLKRHHVQVVADVRSSPFSRHFSQFNASNLKAYLKRQGIQYVPMGEQLGGRPKDESFYDAQGHADYGEMSKADFYLDGLERLKKGIEAYRVAIMCSEENPNECHRRLLIVRSLIEQDAAYADEIAHIRRDGQLQSEKELVANDVKPQSHLFSEVKTAWRSPKSIRLDSQEKVLKPSSAS
ncbi:MAG: DUF488 family protein [Trueperaceae bacterium]